MLVSPEPVSDGLLLSAHTSSHLSPRRLPGGLPLPLHGKREVKSQPLTDFFFRPYFLNHCQSYNIRLVCFVQTIKSEEIAETI